VAVIEPPFCVKAIKAGAGNHDIEKENDKPAKAGTVKESMHVVSLILQL
jgi:hypothetical protein